MRTPVKFVRALWWWWFGCDERGCWRWYHYWCAGHLDIPDPKLRWICPACKDEDDQAVTLSHLVPTYANWLVLCFITSNNVLYKSYPIYVYSLECTSTSMFLLHPFSRFFFQQDVEDSHRSLTTFSACSILWNFEIMEVSRIRTHPPNLRNVNLVNK